jgi:hypothetical protein
MLAPLSAHYSKDTIMRAFNSFVVDNGLFYNDELDDDFIEFAIEDSDNCITMQIRKWESISFIRVSNFINDIVKSLQHVVMQNVLVLQSPGLSYSNDNMTILMWGTKSCYLTFRFIKNQFQHEILENIFQIYKTCLIDHRTMRQDEINLMELITTPTASPTTNSPKVSYVTYYSSITTHIFDREALLVVVNGRRISLHPRIIKLLLQPLHQQQILQR